VPRKEALPYPRSEHGNSPRTISRIRHIIIFQQRYVSREAARSDRSFRHERARAESSSSSQKPEGTARPPYLHRRQCPTGHMAKCRSTQYRHISHCEGSRHHGNSSSADGQLYRNVWIWCNACDIKRTDVHDRQTRTPKHGHCHADALS